MMDFIKHIPVETTQFIWGAIAVIGGIARYLNSYASGVPFNVSIFCASIFVSGFSGWMFAAIIASQGYASNVVYIAAGTGGFFGDQAMKYVLEWAQGTTLQK